ncbi:MAG: universal stress protein [Candidatus Rokubacteria bacterium]|nr:universal stress protein [Candidatus Rokubacteria bacterium]
MRTVLVPLDGSRLAERALAAARQLVAHDESVLVLLQVVAPVNPVHLDRVVRTGPGRTLAARRRRAGRYLEKVRERLARRGVRARIRVRAGDPATEILRAAPAERAGLIAMSTHGRTGVRRVLLGSVAEAVVRRAPLPVLLVRGAARRASRRRTRARTRRAG